MHDYNKLLKAPGNSDAWGDASHSPPFSEPRLRRTHASADTKDEEEEAAGNSLSGAGDVDGPASGPNKTPEGGGGRIRDSALDVSPAGARKGDGMGAGAGAGEFGEHLELYQGSNARPGFGLSVER